MSSKHRSRAALLALIAASPALGNEAPRFNARETVQRARIGTHSPRFAPPVRVVIVRAPLERSDRLEPNGRMKKENHNKKDR